MDASGRVILEDKREALVPDYAVVVPMDRIPAGVYFMHILVKAGTMTAARGVRFTVTTNTLPTFSLQAPPSRQP